MKRTIKLLAAAVIAATPMISAISHAADYPNRPVKFVVPWPPGYLEDTLTRMIADEMRAQTKKPASVVNKPGGGGVVGASAVAQARADGLTVGSFVSDLVTTHILGGNAPYNSETFEPVGIFLEFPFVIATRASEPYNNLEELAEHSKNNRVSLGHFGYQALPTALTYKAADQLGITFASDSPFDNNDCPVLLNGDADVVTTTVSQVQACMKTGEVKLLASITSDRLSISPATQTLAEVTGITQTTWNGLFVKQGTPDHIKSKIASIAKKAVMSEKAQGYIDTTGAGIFWIDGEKSKSIIESDFKATKDLLQYMNR